MHPQLRHRTSTIPLDEAPWLGFFNMQPKTEPARPRDVELPKYMPGSPTPKNLLASDEPNPLDKSNFKFTFSRTSLQLSPDTVKLMEETRAEATRIRQQMISQRKEELANGIEDRKIALPKSKANRFSGVHMAEFKKMDSIANHPSLWRANTSQLDPSNGRSLKRSPSKAELDKPTASANLKRSSSNAGLDKPVLISSLKRSPSRRELNKLRSVGKPTASSKSPFTGIPIPLDTEHSTKRAKFTVKDDVSTVLALPVSPERVPIGRVSQSVTPTPIRSHLFLPTKTSLTRAQSTKCSKDSKIPGLVRSKSTVDLAEKRKTHHKYGNAESYVRSDAPSPSPVKIGFPIPPDAPTPSTIRPIFFKQGEATPRRSGIPSPSKVVKSILRTPHRLYSRDPTKVAAGTHLATPPDRTKITLPAIPATAPVVKHVYFTASAREKAARDEAKNDLMDSESSSLYPDLSMHLSAAAAGGAQPETTHDHRMIFSAPPKKLAKTSDFTFCVGAPISFAPTSPTIRAVRASDADTSIAQTGRAASPKRKADDMLGAVAEESEDKENACSGGPANNDDGDDYRPMKRARTADPPSIQVNKKGVSDTKKAPVTGAAKTKSTASARKGRLGGLSTVRLAFLARPKMRK
jgi:hypothetical protein